MKVLLACLLLLSMNLPLYAKTGFAHTKGATLVGADGQPLLLRGINLGNWFEPEGYMFHLDGGPQSPREIEALTNELLGPAQARIFWKRYRESYISEADIDYLRRAGFNSIRVPLRWELFDSKDAEGFQELDQLVRWSAKAGIYVILDLHCAPGGQTGTNIDDSWGYPWLYDSPADQQHTVAIWQRIARRYRNNPTVLGYDLLNEPIPQYPQLAKYNADLEPVYRKITAAIRQVDTHHVIILGGAQWDSNFKVFGPPFDANVMYTFHKYWTAPEVSVIRQYLEFRDRYHVPIWLGESGENSDAWIAKFVQVLNANQVGWAFWPYKKMDATSSVVSFARPVHWEEIEAFAKLPEGTGHAEQRIAARPPQADVQAAFDDLLEKIKFENCRPNPGYVQALGLTAPATSNSQ